MYFAAVVGDGDVGTQLPVLELVLALELELELELEPEPGLGLGLGLELEPEPEPELALEPEPELEPGLELADGGYSNLDAVVAVADAVVRGSAFAVEQRAPVVVEVVAADEVAVGCGSPMAGLVEVEDVGWEQRVQRTLPL